MPFTHCLTALVTDTDSRFDEIVQGCLIDQQTVVALHNPVPPFAIRDPSRPKDRYVSGFMVRPSSHCVCRVNAIAVVGQTRYAAAGGVLLAQRTRLADEGDAGRGKMGTYGTGASIGRGQDLRLQQFHGLTVVAKVAEPGLDDEQFDSAVG